MNTELISCLCVSRNRTEYVADALTCFLNQSYENKELIFVYEDNNKYISDIKERFNSKLIKYIEVSCNPKKSLGELRNISIQNSDGNVLIQWDDDDIYHKDRITIQYNYMVKKNANAVMLDQRLFLFEDNLYKTIFGPFEGSLIFKKYLYKNKIIKGYTHKAKGEDTDLLIDLLKSNNIEFMNCPYLYLYRYTGENAWDLEHFRDIAKRSLLIKKIDSSKEKIIDVLTLDKSTDYFKTSRINKNRLYETYAKNFYRER